MEDYKKYKDKKEYIQKQKQENPDYFDGAITGTPGYVPIKNIQAYKDFDPDSMQTMEKLVDSPKQDAYAFVKTMLQEHFKMSGKGIIKLNMLEKDEMKKDIAEYDKEHHLFMLHMLMINGYLPQSTIAAMLPVFDYDDPNNADGYAFEQLDKYVDSYEKLAQDLINVFKTSTQEDYDEFVKLMANLNKDTECSKIHAVYENYNILKTMDTNEGIEFLRQKSVDLSSAEYEENMEILAKKGQTPLPMEYAKTLLT